MGCLKDYLEAPASPGQRSWGSSYGASPRSAVALGFAAPKKGKARDGNCREALGKIHLEGKGAWEGPREVLRSEKVKNSRIGVRKHRGGWQNHYGTGGKKKKTVVRGAGGVLSK